MEDRIIRNGNLYKFKSYINWALNSVFLLYVAEQEYLKLTDLLWFFSLPEHIISIKILPYYPDAGELDFANEWLLTHLNKSFKKGENFGIFI